MTAVVDMYPKVFRRGYRRELLILALSVISYFLGLVMLTEVSHVAARQQCEHGHVKGACLGSRRGRSEFRAQLRSHQPGLVLLWDPNIGSSPRAPSAGS